MVKLSKYLLLSLLILVTQNTAGAETCCVRFVGTQIDEPPIPARLTKTTWDSVFTSQMYGGGPYKCPKIEMSIDKTAFDYSFAGTLTIEETSRMESSTLHMQLVDIHRGSVVKEGKIAWYCVDQRRAGACSQTQKDNVMTLAKSFHPLDERIYNYERIPERATIKPEKDLIMAGKKMTVHLTDIHDSKGATPQPWQRILVKAKKGKILNGKPQGEYRVFEVGGGVVDLNYKAPDKCKKDTETITIYNTCEIDPNSVVTSKREIATKEFEIVCLKGRLEATLNPDYDIGHGGYTRISHKYTIEKENSAILPFRLEMTDDPDKYEVVAEEDLAQGTVTSLYVEVFEIVGLVCDTHKRRTRVIQVRVPEGDVNLQRDPQWVLRFHIDLRVYDPIEKNWSTRPVAQGPRISRETLNDSEWWSAHTFWTPIKKEYTEDVGVYRYRLHLEPETVEYLRSGR